MPPRCRRCRRHAAGLSLVAKLAALFVLAAVLLVFLLAVLAVSSDSTSTVARDPDREHTWTVTGTPTLRHVPWQHPGTNPAVISRRVTLRKLPAKKPRCPRFPPGLLGESPVARQAANLTLEKVRGSHPEVLAGGEWRPAQCEPLESVAVLLPYRDRAQHLTTFLAHIHPYLQRQQAHYRIYVIEQAPGLPFNRGMLFNIGFIESQKDFKFRCTILHDVDLLPTNDFNLYRCQSQPIHLSSAIDKFGYNLPYYQNFGGVSAIASGLYQRVNGMANSFWGWGAEDDDLYKRLWDKGYYVSRYPTAIATYHALAHHKESVNPDKGSLLNNWRKRKYYDGLNRLKYDVIERDEDRLYTRILVNVSKSPWETQMEAMKRMPRKSIKLSMLPIRASNNFPAHKIRG